MFTATPTVRKLDASLKSSEIWVIFCRLLLRFLGSTEASREDAHGERGPGSWTMEMDRSLSRCPGTILLGLQGSKAEVSSFEVCVKDPAGIDNRPFPKGPIHDDGSEDCNMYIYICVYIYICNYFLYVYTHIHTHTHIYIYTYIHTGSILGYFGPMWFRVVLEHPRSGPGIRSRVSDSVGLLRHESKLCFQRAPNMA